jgi:hypothetical protein
MVSVPLQLNQLQKLATTTNNSKEESLKTDGFAKITLAGEYVLWPARDNLLT